MSSFLQSPEWQEIQKRMGRSAFRIGGILLIRHDLPLGFNYFYCPRLSFLSDEFFAEASALAKTTGAIFLKIDPTSPLLEIRDSRLEIRPAHSLQPLATVLIDCRKDDQELLSGMHPKTRYNIRLSERHGVSVRLADFPPDENDFEKFWRLVCDTSGREGFSPHPEEHYKILLSTATGRFLNRLFLAEFQGQALAAAIVNFYLPSKTATYLHGASSREQREVMAPHLLHWRVIQEAREQGFTRYDLGGIDEKRWPGLTRFKEGFGGEIHSYPPSQDIISRPWLYRFYNFQRVLRGR